MKNTEQKQSVKRKLKRRYMKDKELKDFIVQTVKLCIKEFFVQHNKKKHKRKNKVKIPASKINCVIELNDNGPRHHACSCCNHDPILVSDSGNFGIDW